MRLLFMSRCLAVLVLAAVVLPGCNKSANRAKECVDQSLKPLGLKKSDMGIFVLDPSSADRAYISVTATYNFADSSGRPITEGLGYTVMRDGEGWRIESSGIKYTDDRETALRLLKGGKGSKS